MHFRMWTTFFPFFVYQSMMMMIEIKIIMMIHNIKFQILFVYATHWITRVIFIFHLSFPSFLAFLIIERIFYSLELLPPCIYKYHPGCIMFAHHVHRQMVQTVLCVLIILYFLVNVWVYLLTIVPPWCNHHHVLAFGDSISEWRQKTYEVGFATSWLLFTYGAANKRWWPFVLKYLIWLMCETL